MLVKIYEIYEENHKICQLISLRKNSFGGLGTLIPWILI